MYCKQIIITGRVQGVFFRASARDKAEELGITGQVRNLPDGSVEIIACGEQAQLQQLIAWCHHGPPRAEVIRVEITDIEVKAFREFRLIRG